MPVHPVHCRLWPLFEAKVDNECEAQRQVRCSTTALVSSPTDSRPAPITSRTTASRPVSGSDPFDPADEVPEPPVASVPEMLGNGSIAGGVVPVSVSPPPPPDPPSSP